MSAAPGSEATGGFLKRHRRALLAVLAVVAVIGFVHFVLPEIVGLGPTLRRLERGNAWWLALGVFVETFSIAGEVVLLRGVFSQPQSQIGWRASYEITLAGAAATKLFATAGAGGVTLTVWALRSAGLGADQVATGMVAYEILNYAVYMAAMAIVGLGLWLGLFSGHAPVGVTRHGLLRRDAGQHPAAAGWDRRRRGRHDRSLSRFRRERVSRRPGGARLSHDLLLASDGTWSGSLRPVASHGGRVANAFAGGQTSTTRITTR